MGMWATRFPIFQVKKTMVSNGVDTLRFPCSALNVKDVRNSKHARTNDRRNHDSHNGSHVCPECQSGSKQARVNGKSNHDNVISVQCSESNHDPLRRLPNVLISVDVAVGSNAR